MKSSRDGDKSKIDMIMFPDKLNEFSSILNTHEGLQNLKKCLIVLSKTFDNKCMWILHFHLAMGEVGK